MTKVYRAAKGWLIFFALLGPPFILLFGYMMLLPFVEDRTESIGVVAFMVIVGGGFSAFFLYSLVAVFRWRVEVYPDRLREVGYFKVRELRFSQVEGIRILPTPYIMTLEFVAANKQAKNMKISMMMADAQEFAAWADATFRNLTREEAESNVRALLQDEALGRDEEERAATFERARKWARVLDVIGWASAIWAMLYPKPYQLAVGVSLAVPIAALMSMRFFPGALHFDVEKRNPRPTIARAFMMPPLAVALRALSDFDIVTWQAFWAPFAVISVLLFALVLVHAADVRRKVVLALLVLIFCAVYGYGATITLNCAFDSAPPKVYRAEVLAKRVSSGKQARYYLKVAPWGPKTLAEDVSVPKSVYEQRRVGDSARVGLFKGRLNIPWFIVR